MKRAIPVLCLLALIASACRIDVPPPRSAPEIGYEQRAWGAWAHLLREHVDDEGRIDFDALREDPSDIDRFVAWVSMNGPELTPARFPTRESEIAFYVNAYNALAMYNVLHSGVLPKKRYNFFYRRRLQIGTLYMSLYDLENDVIRPYGDERVHFWLNCMVRSCPRLPREPLLEETLYEQLDAAAAEFFADPRNVEVRHDLRQVHFNWILEAYTSDFLAVAPSLIDYANTYLDEPIPEGYEVRFLAYDWTLNAQAPEDR